MNEAMRLPSCPIYGMAASPLSSWPNDTFRNPQSGPVGFSNSVFFFLFNAQSRNAVCLMFTLGLQKKKKKNIPLPSLKPSDALTQQANVLVAQHIGSIYQC